MKAEPVYHRSDWPEVGLPASCGFGVLPPLPQRSDGSTGWEQETRGEHLAVRWLAARDAFESRFYGFPVWVLRVEASFDGGGEPREDFFALLREHLAAGIDRLLGAPPWGSAYVCGKVVPGEPLHGALSPYGFEQVEHRRLYRTPVAGIASGNMAEGDRAIRFTSLASVSPDRHEGCRGQILDICREAFGRKGFSRHFTDPFLLGRRPGLDYILAAMQLNFDRLPPAGFLVALHGGAEQVAGFSVFGEKPGLTGATHTQLLSAVRGEYLGRGVYGGLTRLLWQSLPREATLLNVTHADNREMQSAYHKSGRIRLADTVIVRRIFDIGEPIG